MKGLRRIILSRVCVRATRTGTSLGHRKSISVPLGFLAMLCACSPGSDLAEQDFGAARHVIVVSLDTLRADHLGCYGHPYVQTPTIDGLAAQGVRFRDFSSTTSTTLSAHTSLFTGTYPHTHGVLRNGFPVHKDNRMLTEVLAAGGFRCAGFVGASPLDRSVDFHQGFHHYDSEISASPDGVNSFQRPANEVNAAVINWLDGRAGADEDGERLFLFVHYFDIHSPYVHPAPYAGMYRQDELDLVGSIEDLKRVESLVTEATSTGGGRRKQRKEDGFVERLRADDGDALAHAKAIDAEYSAGITWADAQLGLLFEALAERGILDDSLVVLTADHGETLYEHTNLFNHGRSVYDTEIHVPLILRFPDGRHAGQVVERMTSSIDVMPTLLSLLELPLPDSMEGQDISAALSGSLGERAPIFAEATKPQGAGRFNSDPDWPNRDKFLSLRTERFKYMLRLPDKQFRMYDRASDPLEEHNLLRQPDTEQAQVAAEFEALLRTWRGSGEVPRRSLENVSADQQRALEALGYGGADEDE